MLKAGLSYGYKLLSIRDYFSKELFNKIEKKFGSQEAFNTINELTSLGFIDDNKTADNYIRQKLTSGYGPYYIANKLYERGCEKDVSYIENIALKEDIDIASYIIKYSSRYKKENSKDPYKDYIKCINFLRNKGYAQSFIMDIIKKEDFI